MALKRQYTPAEVAAILQVTPGTVNRLIRRGFLRAYRPDGLSRFRIREDDLIEYLEASRYEPPDTLSEPVLYETSPEMARLAHRTYLEVHKRKTG